MKKRMSRILSALLVSALVMSAGNVVQAEDGGSFVNRKSKGRGRGNTSESGDKCTRDNE